jgi:hypothetical protein
MNKTIKKSFNRHYSSMLFAALFALSYSASGADILQQRAVNLGNTNFLDGVAGPGVLVQVIGDFYRGDSFNDNRGNELPGTNELDADALVLQLAVITEYKIWGGNWGYEVLLPAYVDVDPDTQLTGLPTQSGSGSGDLMFSPFLVQWSDSKLFGLPYQHRLNFVFHAPTGEYDRNDQINTGQNYWSFNPYYAGTLHLSSSWSASFRLHYLWNDENDEPAPFAQHDTQVGDAFHMNYAVSYALSDAWRVGAAGYYLNQLSDDEIDGVSQANSKEQVFAIGPGVQYFSHAHKGIFDFNAYFETGAENRTEGYRLVARYRWLL